MTVKIDKNIPLPPVGRGWTKYPYRTMQVGDSFLFESVRAPQSVWEANEKHKPKQFTCRCEGEHYRVWRIK